MTFGRGFRHTAVLRSYFIHVAQIHEDRQNEACRFADTESNVATEMQAERTCSTFIISFRPPFKPKIKAKSSEELEVPELLTQQQRICTFCAFCPPPHFPSVHFQKTSQQLQLALH